MASLISFVTVLTATLLAAVTAFPQEKLPFHGLHHGPSPREPLIQRPLQAQVPPQPKGLVPRPVRSAVAAPKADGDLKASESYGFGYYDYPGFGYGYGYPFGGYGYGGYGGYGYGGYGGFGYPYGGYGGFGYPYYGYGYGGFYGGYGGYPYDWWYY